MIRRTRNRSLVGLALAASLAIAVSAGIALGSRTPAEAPPSAQVIAPGSPSPAPPTSREPRAWAIGGKAPEVRLPVSMTLPAQGAEAERDAVLRDFGEAIAPYRQGRYAEAAKALTRLASRRPDAPEIAYFLGVSRLFAGDPAGALIPLRAARDSTVVADDARWYEAVTLERLGRPRDAEIALRPLCDVPGPYEETACLIVRGR